jgi:hypothetical protein
LDKNDVFRNYTARLRRLFAQYLPLENEGRLNTKLLGDGNLQQTPVSSINIEVVRHYKYILCITPYFKIKAFVPALLPP